jgi:hypothetical protein
VAFCSAKGHFSFAKQQQGFSMLKISSAFFFSTALFSAAVHAMGQEQQWGNWFGTVNAMEFELNTDNSAGERMTLTCRDSHLILNYSGSDKKPLGVPDEGQEGMGININAVHYLPAMGRLKSPESINPYLTHSVPQDSRTLWRTLTGKTASAINHPIR